jgi:hypothetical protein
MVMVSLRLRSDKSQSAIDEHLVPTFHRVVLRQDLSSRQHRLTSEVSVDADHVHSYQNLLMLQSINRVLDGVQYMSSLKIAVGYHCTVGLHIA